MLKMQKTKETILHRARLECLTQECIERPHYPRVTKSRDTRQKSARDHVEMTKEPIDANSLGTLGFSCVCPTRMEKASKFLLLSWKKITTVEGKDYFLRNQSLPRERSVWQEL